MKRYLALDIMYNPLVLHGVPKFFYIFNEMVFVENMIWAECGSHILQCKKIIVF